MADASGIQTPKRPSAAQEARNRGLSNIYIFPSSSRLDATAAEQSRFSPDTPSPPPQQTESAPRRSFASTFTRHTRERSRDQAYRASPPRSQTQTQSGRATSTKSRKHPSPSSSPEHYPSQLPPEHASMSTTRPSSLYPIGSTTRQPASIGAGSGSTSSTKVGNAIGKLLVSVRNWGGKEPDIMIPIQPPQHNWPPLHVEKQCTSCTCNDPKRRRTRRIWLALFIILLLFLVANTIVLNVRVISLTSQPLDNRAPGWTGQLSTDQAECLSQFTLNAPADPSSYPCSSCLPFLSQVPPSFAMTSPADAQGVQNAVQFCGLQAMFDSADRNGKVALNATRWLRDVRFCTWGGVKCSSSGMVSSLELTFPAVPGIIPTEIGSLSGLQSLQIVGNGEVPAGDFPSSIKSLSALSTLHLESTGMNALPDDLFTSLKSVMTLLLLGNANFGGGMPSSIGSSSLQSLVIDQRVTTSLSDILSGSTLQRSLQFLSITSAGLSTSIPDTISSFSSLVELHLDDNNLQPPFPSAFPSTLQILSLSNNSALSGSLPGSLCSSSALRTCDMRQTGLSSDEPCGPCQF